MEDARDDVGAEGVEVRREVAVAEADGVRAVAVETHEANLHRHRVYRGLAKATALVLERAEGRAAEVFLVAVGELGVGVARRSRVIVRRAIERRLRAVTLRMHAEMLRKRGGAGERRRDRQREQHRREPRGRTRRPRVARATGDAHRPNARSAPEKTRTPRSAARAQRVDRARERCARL